MLISALITKCRSCRSTKQNFIHCTDFFWHYKYLLLNPNLHSRGQICPHYFQSPITKKCKNQQKLSIPRKTSAKSMSWVMYPSKNAVLCLFSPQNRSMPEKWWLTVYSIFHSRLILAHIQVGGGGRAGARGRQMGWTDIVELSRDIIPPTLPSILQPSLTGVGRFTHKSCGRIRPHLWR
jgi:hypothetical protein